MGHTGSRPAGRGGRRLRCRRNAPHALDAQSVGRTARRGGDRVIHASGYCIVVDGPLYVEGVANRRTAGSVMAEASAGVWCMGSQRRAKCWRAAACRSPEPATRRLPVVYGYMRTAGRLTVWRLSHSVLYAHPESWWAYRLDKNVVAYRVMGWEGAEFAPA